MGPRRTCRVLQPCKIFCVAIGEPVLLLGTFRLQTVNQPISLSSARFGSWPRECSEQLSNFCEFCTQLPGSLILQALRCQPLRHRGGHVAAIAGVCRRRRRVRGSTYRLVIVALPRPAAFLGAALGRGPDFCGSYLLCLLAHAVPAGWIPRLR